MSALATRHRIARALAAGMILALPAGAMAAEPSPRIVVNGEGEVAVAPDMATISLTVLREAGTARAALDANNEAMAGVLEAMKNQGIEDRDLQTSGFSIQPRYVYPKQSSTGESEPPRIVGYQVSNSLTVRIRDMVRVGAILDASVSLGVNQGGSVSFSNADPSAALDDARRKAVQNAVAKARIMAEAAGVSVGPILEMSESSWQPGPQPMMAPMARGAAAEAVPMAAGENTYRVNIAVTFAIKQ